MVPFSGGDVRFREARGGHQSPPAGHPAVIQMLLDHRASLVQQAPDGVRSPGDQKSHGWSHLPKTNGIWYSGRVWENWP